MPSGGWFPGILTRHWRLKLAALVLAFLLWTSLRVEAVDRQVLPSVPVRVQLNDPQWAVQSEPEPTTVEVQFSGPAGDLMGLFMDRPTVTVPVDAVSSADTSVTLRPEWVRLPDRPEVTVEAISPVEVALHFEPITQAMAPVSVRTEGSLASELALAEPLAAEPPMVRISGPASELEGVDSVALVPLELSQVSMTGARAVPVDTTGIYGLLISPGRVQVRYNVDERATRTLPEIPIVPPPGSTGIQVTPATASLVVTGARSLLEPLSDRTVWMEIPPDQLQGLEPGEERTVSLEVRGVPALVEAEAQIQEAQVRRVGASEASNP